MPRAADLLVSCLVAHGVDRIFCVPGESYLAVLDALIDAPGIDLVTTRHEGGGGFMAVADAKMSRRPAVQFVSRGPGATNAAIGVHVAEQDAVPLILFVGQVAREDLGRGALQEMDYSRLFAGVAKWSAEITEPGKIPSVVRRAFAEALSGTPGPVVVSLPEDMLRDETGAPVSPPSPVPLPAPAPAEIAEIARRIAAAERPLMIAGGRVEWEDAREELRRASEALQIPVACGWRRQDAFDHSHPNYAGHLGFGLPPVFRDTYDEADLIVALGTRLGDVTTQGYAVPAAPTPHQPLIHVYPDPGQIGRNFVTDLGVVAAARPTLEGLAAAAGGPVPNARGAWIERLNGLARGNMAWDGARAEDGVVFGNVIAELARQAEDDAIVAIDAGNFSAWTQRLFPFKATQRLIGPVAGAMGMGVPGAIAASLRAPERQVVCLVGDGGMQMTGAEMAIAAERKLPITVIVSNNGSWGTIRTHQEKFYPGRTVATALHNPDFVKLAEAYGVEGIRVETEDQVAGALARALGAGGPVIVDVKTSLEYISPYATLSGLAKG